jgi:2-Cys peroxiredoxin 5
MPLARAATLRLAAAAARPLARGPAAASAVRPFHATARAPVSVGDRLPDVELMETSPGTKVNLARELARGKALIVGVPAAFSAFFSSPEPMLTELSL